VASTSSSALQQCSVQKEWIGTEVTSPRGLIL
jgi:hypothetical protein